VGVFRNIRSWLRPEAPGDNHEPRHAFVRNPEDYHKEVICLYGRVDRVFKNPLGETVKRFLIDKFRTLIKSNNRVGRHSHQRFVLDSPGLEEKENVLVFHNLKFGKKKLKPGVWVEVQGEYIHRTSRVRAAFGFRSTKYGRIHYTHEPRGHLRVLKSKPSSKEVSSILIVDS